jgi:DNA-binding NarL/FixJ family response regulator
MRVVLVGTPAERDRLRAGLGASVDIVGEFSTLAAARAASRGAQAILVAATRNRTARASGNDRGPRGFGTSVLDEDAPVEEIEPLTPREIEVLELLAEGLPNKGIAARLGISDQTVKFHVAAIAGKLGAANRTDAVRIAVRRGLIAL